RVFPDWLTIKEQPHLQGALGSAPFDGEGVATQPRTLIEHGILRGYVLSSYSARKLGMQTTGNAGGIHNLVVEPGAMDYPQLLQDMHQGLVVSHLMGQGVNPVTGDYSRGAAGFWVENGEVAFPVEEITIAGRLREMFENIRAVGRDVDIRGNIRTGSVLVEGMTIAGE
ncbi:MAG: metallopeptidase TldD-related protein, partial [Nitrococcus sp.]|nr:metallopeptidase TldD-related protein [Nitrococcus sp.]